MEFATIGTTIRAEHRDNPRVVYRGNVKTCFSLGIGIYAITIETIYASVITVTNAEFSITKA